MQQAEMALRIDDFPTLVYTMTPTCELEFFNRQVAEYFGKPSHELADWEGSGLVHPEDIPAVKESLRRTIEFGEPHEVQHRLRRADGEYRWFQPRATAMRDEEGRILRWFAVLNDIEDLKQAKQAILAREAELRAIVNTIPGLVATMKATGEVEFVNQRILDYTGWELERFADWSPLVHPDDLPTTVGKWMRSLESGCPYDSTHRLLGADGRWRWFQTRGVALNDASGRRVRWYMLLTDLEDHVRAEEELRESKAFLLEAQRLSQTGSWKHDLASGQVTFTPEVARMFALPQEQDSVSVELFFDRMHPEDRKAEALNYERAVASRCDLQSLYRIVLPDGSVRYIRNTGHPRLNTDGQVTGFVGTAMDVTEQWRARTDLETAFLAIQEREQQLNLIIETIPGLIWCAAASGEVIYVNRQVLQYCGATRESFLSGRWTDFVHPDDLHATVAAWQQSVSLHEPYELQYRLRRADGDYRWFHVIGQPARNAEGEVIRWYGLLIDIHERKTAEDTLRLAEARLARASQMATVAELSASIAHEVNQPLAAVVANAHAALRWLAADPPNLAKAREAAERILRDGKDASAVVQRVRSLFRRGPLDRTPVDVSEIVREVVELLHTETSRVGIRVELSLAADLPPLRADRVQLQQVLLNLARNGIEAMESVRDRAKILRICAVTSVTGDVEISVEDCGVGLSGQDKIFDAFFTTRENGMGMGLAISRSIIEAHQGRLWAESAVPFGATFRFSLPVRS